MTSSALSVFENCGAIIRNSHLVYTSGRHGSAYVNKDALYPRTEVIADLCSRMAEAFADDKIDVVLGPALGGIILAQWTAHALQEQTGKPVLALFAEKAPDSPDGFILKRGYENLISGKRTILVEDILTTGGSVKKVVGLAERMGANVIGVAALCNRGGIQAADLGTKKLVSLAEVSLESWEAGTCPLCAKGVPINKSLGKG